MVFYLSVIRVRRLIPIFLALIVVSAVISFTVSTFVGAYITAVDLMGSGGGDVLVIYGAGSKAPQTSVVPLSLYDKLRDLEGVEVISPEVVSAVIAGDKVLVVRGIDPAAFLRINHIRVVTGAFLLDNSISALAGRKLASSLKLKVGDFVLLRSAFSSNFLEVKIQGIFESDSYLDDELLVPIYVAQWIRGLPRDAVSLIRVKVDLGKLSEEDLFLYLRGEKQVERKTSPVTQSSIMRLLAVPRARKYAVEYAVKSPIDSMRSFLEREVRVNEAVVWSVVATVISGAVLLVYLTSSLMVTSHSREITILRSLGASRKRLTLSMLVFIGSLSIGFSVLGFAFGALLSSFFSESGLIVVGPYSVKPIFTFWTLILTVAAVALMVAVSVKIELESIIRGEYRRA